MSVQGNFRLGFRRSNYNLDQIVQTAKMLKKRAATEKVKATLKRARSRRSLTT